VALRPEPVPPETLARVAALDARCDWSIRRGERRGQRVYFVRVWERRADDGAAVSGWDGATSFYRWTLADALLALALAAESRGWHRPK
jgi:hypothetical protein